ncbi:MAG TPA: Rrf2 family transcriptional regulator [Acidimicrobiales bacterium]|nr:Rrf2 family transcriptional regulator [Acidimicrobiales bacterium]
MYISAKADYAARALLMLAAAGGGPLKGEVLAREQGLPQKFLENTLTTLRRAGVLETHRGADGGYRLARPADRITIADIMRPLDGPLAEVRGEKPEEAVYEGAAAHLRDVWVAVRAALRDVLETVTLADVVDGDLPPHVRELLERPGAWERRPLGTAAGPGPRPETAGATLNRRRQAPAVAAEKKAASRPVGARAPRRRR